MNRLINALLAVLLPLASPAVLNSASDYKYVRCGDGTFAIDGIYADTRQGNQIMGEDIAFIYEYANELGNGPLLFFNDYRWCTAAGARLTDRPSKNLNNPFYMSGRGLSLVSEVWNSLRPNTTYQGLGYVKSHPYLRDGTPDFPTETNNITRSNLNQWEGHISQTVSGRPYNYSETLQATVGIPSNTKHIEPNALIDLPTYTSYELLSELGHDGRTFTSGTIKRFVQTLQNRNGSSINFYAPHIALRLSGIVSVTGHYEDGKEDSHDQWIFKDEKVPFFTALEELIPFNKLFYGRSYNGDQTDNPGFCYREANIEIESAEISSDTRGSTTERYYDTDRYYDGEKGGRITLILFAQKHSRKGMFNRTFGIDVAYTTRNVGGKARRTVDMSQISSPSFCKTLLNSLQSEGTVYHEYVAIIDAVNPWVTFNLNAYHR